MLPSRKSKTREPNVVSQRTTDLESSPSPRASQNDSGDSVPARKKPRRTALTRNACTKCRLAKAKCSGKHPSCARCEASNVSCVYDVSDEGVTRTQNLQQKLEVKTRDYDRVMSVLQRLQSGTDNEAAGLLARLRFGESVEQVTEGMALHYIEASTGGGSELSSPQDQDSMSGFQNWAPLPDQHTYAGMEYYFSQTIGSSPDLPQLASRPVQPTQGAAAGRHNPLGSSVSPSPMDTYDPNSPHGYQLIDPYYTPNATYRHLPQISFRGATWPSGSEAGIASRQQQYITSPPPELYHSRHVQPSVSKSPQLSMQATRSPSSQHYDGFLWPCSAGDGMPGIGGPRGISMDRRYSNG
ncbi:hypothetical protein LTR86_002349 [Recurvomyces mirabilis]|nr:hypothetical protein LTR86_002349 [Recurvomyces mirabilis]